MTSIPSELRELLEKCLHKKLDSSDITVLDGNKKGTGYVGDIMFLSIKNGNSLQEDNIIIKNETKSDNEIVKNFVASCYFNEIHFYTKIWPAIKRLQNSFPTADQFEVAPKLYGVSNEPGKRKIILENLKIQNYVTHPLQLPLDEHLYEYIFKLYAQYHATSFALKHYEPKTFLDLIQPLNDNWSDVKNLGIFDAGIKKTASSLKRALENLNRADLLIKMQPFITDGVKVFLESFKYNGTNSVIKHGDCWSNNVLIKYNGSNKIEDIKLIDFQMCNTGTPIHDLTYSFYSGANKNTLGNWKRLLKLYHETLSKSLKGYNLEVEKIYPYDELEKEWKEYSRFGFLIGLLAWGYKFQDDEDIPDLNASVFREQYLYTNTDYIIRLMDLIQHYDENGFLYY